MTKPSWNKPGVYQWAISVLKQEREDAELEQERDFALYYSDFPGPTYRQVLEGAEQEAVELATSRGDFSLLLGLLDPCHPFNQADVWPGAPIWSALKPSTWQLIERRMLGQFRRRRGRVKKTRDERLEETPTHMAAQAVRHLEEILRKGYPRQKHRDVCDKAIEIAAWHFNVSPSKKNTATEVLANYLARSTKNRRRLS
jgi:hypothetical protein